MPKAPPIFRLPSRAKRKTPRIDLRTRERKGNDFYTLKRWRDLRKMFLSAHPLCAECERYGRATPAREVDHVQPRILRPDLEYHWDNLRALCKPCHSRKTATENAR